MHLKRIEIDNFQSIKKVVLELGKYTVLVGASDKGKSAIIRAIFSVFTNPAGQSKIRKGASASDVNLIFDDGLDVTLSKSKSASYKVTWPNGKGRAYERMGREVPAELQEIVTPWQVEEATYYVQFQRQLGTDPLFILSPSGGRGGMMRALDDLDAKPYRKALAECQSSVRTMHREFNDLKKQEAGWDEKLEKLTEVEELVKKSSAAERMLSLMEKFGRLIIVSRLPKFKKIGVVLRHVVLRTYELPVISLEALGLLVNYEQLRHLSNDVTQEFKEVKVWLDGVEKKLFEGGICPLCNRGGLDASV